MNNSIFFDPFRYPLKVNQDQIETQDAQMKNKIIRVAGKISASPSRFDFVKMIQDAEMTCQLWGSLPSYGFCS